MVLGLGTGLLPTNERAVLSSQDAECGPKGPSSQDEVTKVVGRIRISGKQEACYHRDGELQAVCT